jgi:hypothetical protein
VITARAGTPLREIERLLAQARQFLPFEPPRFRGGGTLGGAVACGLSGPGRPWRGAARDAVLGAELLNGRGEVLRFGGQVMKNVAGYDVSRLQAGAFGTLGVLLAREHQGVAAAQRGTHPGVRTGRRRRCAMRSGLGAPSASDQRLLPAPGSPARAALRRRIRRGRGGRGAGRRSRLRPRVTGRRCATSAWISSPRPGCGAVRCRRRRRFCGMPTRWCPGLALSAGGVRRTPAAARRQGTAHGGHARPFDGTFRNAHRGVHGCAVEQRIGERLRAGVRPRGCFQSRAVGLQ